MKDKMQPRETLHLPLPSGDFVILYDMLAQNDASNDEVNRNVYRVCRDGKIVWQIEAGASEGERQPFTNVALRADGGLHAYCWSGAGYPVDVETGTLGQGTFVR